MDNLHRFYTRSHTLNPTYSSVMRTNLQEGDFSSRVRGVVLPYASDSHSLESGVQSRAIRRRRASIMVVYQDGC